LPQTPPDTERDTLVEKIRGRFDAADKGVHKRFRDKSEHFYALYRNYTDFRDGQRGTDRRDRDLGQEFAALHQRLGYSSQLRIALNIVTQHVTCRQVRQMIPLRDALGLRSLAGPRWAQQDHGVPQPRHTPNSG